jgi:XapX domain-containing protein
VGVVDAVRDVAVAALTGGVVGAVFAVVRLDPPAPATWAGLAGIAGIVAGWMAVSKWVG